MKKGKINMILKFNDANMNLLNKEKIILVISTIIFILSNILVIFIPNILGEIIDIIISTNNIKKIKTLIFLFLIISLFIILLQYLSSYMLNRLSKNLNIRMSTYIFENIKRKNLIYWYKESKGEIVTIISDDIYTIVDYITNSIPSLFSLIISLIIIFIYIISLNVSIAIIIFIINIILILIQIILSKIIKNKSKTVRDSNAIVNSKINSIINNIESLLLKDYLKSSSENFYKSNEGLFTVRNNLMDKILQSSTINLLASLFSIFIIVWLGGILANSESISAGNLVTLILYSQKIFSPLTNITRILMKFNTIIPKKNKIDDLLDSENLIDDFLDSKKIVHKNLDFSTIDFSNLLTGYKDNNIKIKNLKIDFRKNNIVGIIGDNGSGKTTFIKLLRKILPIKEGIIKIDNIPLDDISLENLFYDIQVMPQTDFLNKYDISFVKQFISETDLDKDISKFLGDDLKLLESPIKYEYNFNSKGELQKLSFLNTIFKKAKLYILDEPSSSIDLQSEKYMAEIIKNISGQKKFIIITHRPELLNICHEIIDLSN